MCGQPTAMERSFRIPDQALRSIGARRDKAEVVATLPLALAIAATGVEQNHVDREHASTSEHRASSRAKFTHWTNPYAQPPTQRSFGQ